MANNRRSYRESYRESYKGIYRGNYHRQQYSGITLIELMIALAVASILIAVGVPSLQNMIVNSQLDSERDTLWRHIMLTRSEAIRRGQQVQICASTDSSTCSQSNNWESGWLIWADQNSDNSADAEEIIEAKDSAAGAVTISSARSALIYNQKGFLATVANTTFNFCSEDIGGLQLIINGIGRPRMDDEGVCQ